MTFMLHTCYRINKVNIFRRPKGLININEKEMNFNNRRSRNSEICIQLTK